MPVLKLSVTCGVRLYDMDSLGEACCSGFVIVLLYVFASNLIPMDVDSRSFRNVLLICANAWYFNRLRELL